MPIIPGQPMPGMQPGMQGQQPPQNPLIQVAQEMNKKLDIIIEHLGIENGGKMDSGEYLNKDDDEKDAIDAKQVLGKA